MEDFSYLRHLKDRNDMNPVAVRFLNQQLVAPQFSDPAEVVSYMGAIQAQEYRMMRWAVAMRTDIDFKGCKSCFACKIKNSKTNGVCALKDDLRPVLERLEKPSTFDPRGQATLTLTGKIRMTLCGKIRLTPECNCHSGAFL